MFFIRRIAGHSMLPTLASRQIVIFKKSKRFQTGQIVAARADDIEVVKRLLWQNKQRAHLRGDNSQSAAYSVPAKNLEGVLIFKL